MKRNINYLFLILLSSQLVGCFDLNTVPYDKPSSNTYWQTETQCKAGVMGIYEDLKREKAYGDYFVQDNMSDIGVAQGTAISYPPYIWGTATVPQAYFWKNGRRITMESSVPTWHLKIFQLPSSTLRQRINSLENPNF